MKMTVREKIAELTAGVKSQSDIDSLVAKYNGLGGLVKSEFSGCNASEFMYEFESMKLKFKKQTRSY
jgi:hypothetical protein